MASASKAPDVVHTEPDAGSFARHKAEYSDMCPICGPRIAATRERHQRIDAFFRGFRQFGYSTVTREDVSGAYDIAIARKPEAEDSIFVRLIRSQLEEAGLV